MTTIRAGVAGQPISRSLSPALHRDWIAAAGLDATYAPFGPADGAGFDALVAEARTGTLRGLNVTAPFKSRALALADEASATARRCGSANLLIFDGGKVYADSTDGFGLMAALAEQAPGLDVAGRSVVMLGAGGAARAAVAALDEAGAGVWIVNRSQDRAAALAADLGGAVRVAEDGGPLAEAALVVNALSVQPEIDVSGLPDDAVVMDMTYRPVTTALLATARARGLRTVDGLGMLIGQARPSFEAFYGVAPPDIDARAAVLAALEETS